MRFNTPLALSTDPALDIAFRKNGEAWLAAVHDRGADATARWIVRRSIEVELNEPLVYRLVANLMDTVDPAERCAGLIEFAETVQEGDVELAQLLWYAVRDHALATNNVDLLAGSTSRIAAIAFELDEVRDAGRAWTELLTWRRKPESSSEPELVLIAFDQLITAAEMTGMHRDAARIGYLQVEFQQLVESGDSRASKGDWMSTGQKLVDWE